MGRKPAPQPLALSDPTALVGSQSIAGETLKVPSPSSPSSPRSPKSPRSPFRFGQKKSPSLAESHPSSPLHSSQPQAQAASEEAQSKQSVEIEHHYQPIDEAIHKSLLNTPTTPNTNVSISLIPPTTTTAVATAQPGTVLNQSIPETSSVSHQQQEQKQRRSEEEANLVAPVGIGKSTKSGGGRFFHFSKTSRPSHQQYPSTTPHNNNGGHASSPGASLASPTSTTVPRGEKMSRDLDRPTVPIPMPSSSSKSSKHSGKTLQRDMLEPLQTPGILQVQEPPQAENENAHLRKTRPWQFGRPDKEAAGVVQETALLEYFRGGLGDDGHPSAPKTPERGWPSSNGTLVAAFSNPANSNSIQKSVSPTAEAAATAKATATADTSTPPGFPTPVLAGVRRACAHSATIVNKTPPVSPGGLAGHDVAKSPLSSIACFISDKYPILADHSVQKSIPSHHQNPSKSDLSLASTGETDAASSTAASTPAKRGKPKPFALLNRTRSNRDKDIPSPQDGPIGPALTRLTEPERVHNALKTAPVAHERSFRDMMNSAVRNRSEDRGGVHIRDTSLHREEKHSRTQPSSFKDNSGSNFLSNLRNSSRMATDIISKGIFGKNARSGSTNEREPIVDDEHYQLRAINLPLIEQARLTRISKRLEDSRDKTEFWMPAFPWRAIDYLNYKGCDVEGLYRVPGSGPQVKKWQRKFDEEYDVDLFAQDDLYDINIVGSMLKAWLRELPDELFPKVAQERIARECAGADTVPELLREELSNLPPFHYYLLFAITCHLSLLLAHSDKNKMDFRNLCICFQPCMKIDAFCFKFLVCDWRDCWKGCKNEAKYIEEEYTIFDQPPPPGIGNDSKKKRQQEPSNSAADERAVSSSDSKQSAVVVQENQKGRLKKKPVPQPESNGSVVASHPAISTTLTVHSEREPRGRKGELTLRPLSPIKPLSPLGF